MELATLFVTKALSPYYFEPTVATEPLRFARS